MNVPRGVNLHLQKGPLILSKRHIQILTSHLAYVARAEIKMSILSFLCTSCEAEMAACRSNSPLSTPFLEEEQKTTLNASHLYTYTQHLGLRLYLFMVSGISEMSVLSFSFSFSFFCPAVLSLSSVSAKCFTVL